MTKPSSDEHVYFLHESDTGRLKIGYSGNLKTRMNSAKTDNSHDLVLLGTLPGGRRAERAVQDLFRAYSIKREWFRAEEEVLSAVRRMLVRGGSPQTVEDELNRRDDCRYGLRGVLVAVRGESAEPWVIGGSEWDAYERLRLYIYPGTEIPKKPFEGMVYTLRELSEWTEINPARKIAAEDCFLLSRWPVVCRCWLPELKEDRQ